MTPENIAGFKIPKAQLEELITALAAMHSEPRAQSNVVPLRPRPEQKAA